VLSIINRKFRFAASLSICIFFLVTVALAKKQTPAAPEDFTIVVLPDTQYYSASYPQIFNAQTRWIADNRDALNIQLVIGVGDIVDGPMEIAQWQNADAAVRLLDGVVPYVLAIGNHDYDNVLPGARQVTNFNQWFGPSRYAGYSWYGGNYPDGSNENFYATVRLGGRSYLVLALEYIPRQSALDWADGILRANADKPVILVTHSYMYRDNTTVDPCDTADNTASTKTNGADGMTMWRQFVGQYPNITTVLSGHILGVGQRSDIGVNGNLVNQMLVDYQGWANGGNGYLRIMTFQPSIGRVQVQTYSPYLGVYLTDAANQFDWNLAATPSLSVNGNLKGRVRRGRIGTPSDCAAIAGATVATADASASADGTGAYSLDTIAGPRTVTASGDGWLASTETDMVAAGFSMDAPMFLYPDQNYQSLCDVSSAPDHSVTFCAPGTAPTPSPVRIAAQSKVNQGFVNLMQLYVDGASKGQTYTNQLDTTLDLASGTHRVVAKARDTSGVYFSNTISVSIAAPPICDVSSAPTPSVTICAPAPNATVSSPVQVTAQGKDSFPIIRMQLYVDGVAKYTVSSDQLNTPIALTSGVHRLSVVSTNNANATTKATISVTVQ